MEYDGATTASVAALEHEVFHSWFGRGVKPARAADGWIDEAWTTWATASQRSEQPRFSAIELPLDDPPVVLYPPQHPWARHTPRSPGPIPTAPGSSPHWRFSSEVLNLAAHGHGRLVPGQRRTGWPTTDGLAAHLHAWSGHRTSARGGPATSTAATGAAAARHSRRGSLVRQFPWSRALVEAAPRVITARTAVTSTRSAVGPRCRTR